MLFFANKKDPNSLSLNEFGDIWTKFLWDICSVQRVLSFEYQFQIHTYKLFKELMWLLFTVWKYTVRQDLDKRIYWFLSRLHDSSKSASSELEFLHSLATPARPSVRNKWEKLEHKPKPFLTSHLWYEAMLKVWRKSW